MVALSKRGFKISVSNYIDAKANALGIHTVWDKGLTDATNTDSSIIEWLSFVFGAFDTEGVCEGVVTAYLLTRQDPEYLKNAELHDKLMSFFSDPTMPDGNARIPFYEVIGGVLVQTSTMWLARASSVTEFTLMDETKVCPTILVFSWTGTL